MSSSGQRPANPMIHTNTRVNPSSWIIPESVARNSVANPSHHTCSHVSIRGTIRASGAPTSLSRSQSQRLSCEPIWVTYAVCMNSLLVNTSVLAYIAVPRPPVFWNIRRSWFRQPPRNVVWVDARVTGMILRTYSTYHDVVTYLRM